MRRLRVCRFWGSDPVVGDAVSVCFLFKDELDMDGVMLGPDGVEPDPEACPDVDGGPAGCDIVLCCFCGELLAEATFCRGPADGPGWGSDGAFGGAGALEYKVTAGDNGKF